MVTSFTIGDKVSIIVPALDSASKDNKYAFG